MDHFKGVSLSTQLVGKLDHAEDEDRPKAEAEADDRGSANRSRPFSVLRGFFDHRLERARGTSDVSTAIRVLGQGDVRPFTNGLALNELFWPVCDLHIVPDLALRQHLERAT